MLCTALCLAAQVRINYEAEDFVLGGFDKFSATLEDQGIAFDGDGKPLKIELKSSGTTITGANAEGNATRGDNRAYFLKNATITGNANLVMDGQAADEYRLRQKAAIGLQPGPKALTKTQIQSDILKYSGTAADGRVEFPGAVTIDSSSRESSTGAKNVPTLITRSLHLTGASGFLTMLINGAGNNALQKGEIAGPVTYNGESHVKPEGAPEETTTFQGRADNMKFDFTAEPRTLTLTGNVTLSSKGPAASGDISADIVVVTVDANLKPLKIDITGSPAKTTLHQEPPR